MQMIISGKDLSGARLIIYPSQNATFIPEENIIIGNVHFMVLLQVKHLFVVKPANVLLYVTQVQMLLWKVLAIMVANT